MFVPNKALCLNESILYKSIKILKTIDKEIEVFSLYQSTKRYFSEASEFIDAIDLLFVLGIITFDKEKGVIIDAQKN